MCVNLKFSGYALDHNQNKKKLIPISSLSENGMIIKMTATVMMLTITLNNNRRREIGKRGQSLSWTSSRGEEG